MTVALFVVSFFTPNDSLDIHLHDTYIIIKTAWLFWLGIIPLLTLWTLYYLTKHLLFSKALMWTHILLTIITLILLVSISFCSNSYYSELGGMPRRYYDYSAWNNFSLYDNLTKVVFITVILLILAQLIYILNFILGIFRNFIAPHNSR